MNCESCTEKLDAYFDGELSPDEARALNDHLRQCATCAAEGLIRVQQKRTVQTAAQRFTPDPAFRTRIQKNIALPRPILWSRRWFSALATVTASVLIVGFLIAFEHNRRSDQQLFSELVDQHVSTLASANPVDVISTDRHTVKPWFEGRIPFTFNLPELQGSPFVLVGGKVSYLGQSPGAELIFRVRQHQISLFIFREQELKGARESEGLRTTHTFEVRTWQHDGLRYFVVGDVNSQDLNQLIELIKAAG